MKKSLTRNPSFTPCPSLRVNLETRREGTTERLNQIWHRYEYLLLEEAIHLEPEELSLLKRILMVNVASQDIELEPSKIHYISTLILNSEQYIGGEEIAVSLYGKLVDATYPELLSLIENIGL
ncbi:hypothetical protein [Vibrio fluvialis]|uniref:hypothetical protein n=1 Tax=Vibrio fluvialis TaxID=676 RepID=UPI00192CC598|nr:hypothetical protein [Vibrio fluvialis]MBL4262807.1 hypothetical protein [Vibrio fluvialis]